MSNDWYYNGFINELKNLGRPGSDSVTGSISKVVTLSLPSDNWVEEGQLYIQTINVSSVTSNKQIDMRPSPEQLHELLESGISLTAVNDSGVVKVVAIGGKPATDYSIQIIVSDVEGA